MSAGTRLVVRLDSRRRKRGMLAQKLQHAIPAVPLLFQGMEALRAGVHGFELGLAVLEVVTSAFLLVTVGRALRQVRQPGASAAHHHGHGVDWAHIWAAGVLFAEVGERWHLHHHLARPILLTALVTLGLGFFHSRLVAWGSERRSLRIDESGVRVGRRPFGTFAASWTDLAAVRITERDATISARDGRSRRIDLLDLENQGEVRRALATVGERLKTITSAK
jgi:hypothetical protein